MTFEQEIKLIKIGFTFVFILIVFSVWFFLIDPKIRPAIRFINVDPRNIQLEKDVYSPGEMVYGYTAFCKKRKAFGYTQWTLVNDQFTIFTPHNPSDVGRGVCYPQNAKKGTTSFLTFPIERIPDNASSGQHYFSGVITQTLTGNRTVKIPLKTEIFIVK